MEKDDRRDASYVHKVQEETQRFIQGLLTENERLRSLVATLRSEKLSLEESLHKAKEALRHHEQEQARLQQQLADIEEENRRFSKEYVEVERQNSNLANLYVASYRLHGTLNRKEILATIQEIIINLIGSEELGIFELDPQAAVLSLVASYGIDAACYQEIPVGSGIIGHVALTGEAYLAGDVNRNDHFRRVPEEDTLTACIPLKVEGRVTGAIVVFRLLQQKCGLEAVDHELFNLLATHSAMALYCSGLHARVRAVPEHPYGT